MIISYENRLQYFYFFLSGLVASALLILVYISMHTTLNENRKENLKSLQKSLDFIKPSTSWNYNNTWQPIGTASLKHQIYSAYFDARTEIFEYVDDDNDSFLYASLRIFAILPLKMSDTITCHVRHQDFTVTQIASLEFDAMHEHHNAKFASYSIMCPLRTKRNVQHVLLPLSVAISYASNSLSRTKPTYVPISYPKHVEDMLQKSKPEIAICVGPLQRHYGDALRLAEFVEMYRLQGASRFYFYRVDASDEVLNLLEYYRSLGVAEILDWDTLFYGEDVHYAGIVAQFNECVFRTMVVESYRYAAIVDLDEIIMPMKHNSLLEFLRQCDEGRTSGFVFRNVFYYKKDPNDMFTVPPHVRNRFLYTQNKVRRTVEVMPPYLRSKCVVNTRSIVEMGNHQVWRTLPGYSDNVVHPSVGLLYHYRDKCINCKSLLMVDYTARRFGSLIWDRVDEACLKVFLSRGGLCPTAV